MFSARFNSKDLKVQLKLAINRIKMLMRKKENQGLLAKKEVAELLGKDKVELARIKTELIIKDDYLIETLEILEVYFNVILSRMGLIERQKEVHPEIQEAIMTILWAGPRLEADLSEMNKICGQLTARFGKPVAEDAMANTAGLASDRVVKKMTVVTPPRALVEAYLAAIAKTYNVMYNYIEPVDPSMMDPSMQSTVTPDMFPEVPGTGGGPSMPPGGGGGGGGFGGLPFPTAPGQMPPPPNNYQPEPSAQQMYPPQAVNPQMPGGIFPPPGGPAVQQPSPMMSAPPPQAQQQQPMDEKPKEGGCGWDGEPAPVPGSAPPNQPMSEKASMPPPTAPGPVAPAYTEEAPIDPFPMPPSDGISPDALTPSGFPTAPGQDNQPPADANVPEFEDLLSRFKQLKDE